MSPAEIARRDAWLAARRQHITSTALASIMGLPDAYGSPMSVWLDIKGLLERDEAAAPAFMEAGIRLQPVILEWYADRRGVAIEHMDPYALAVCEAHPVLAASLDARWHADDHRPVDAKNVRIKRPEEWGPEGTDQMPARFVVQLHAQMLCTGTAAADLAVLFGGADPAWYGVGLDQEIAAGIVEAAETFWTRHVLADVPPHVDGSEDWSRFLAGRRERSSELVRASPAADALVAEYVRARAAREEAEAQERLARNQLADLIGDAAGMTGTWGRISYKATKGRESTDWEAVARELAAATGTAPDIVEQYRLTHTTRSAGARVFRPTINAAVKE